MRIAESLNVGLRAATGEYIARMDADDIAGKERLEIQVAYMDQHPEIDICGLKVDDVWRVHVGVECLHGSCVHQLCVPLLHTLCASYDYDACSIASEASA